jgi:class 3 adenylate cyclase
MKWLGDGVMFRSHDPAEGVLGALELVEATIPAGLPPAHVGMHVGAVVERDGDVFGRTVNLASRISNVAGPGEMLVTRETTEVVGGRAGVAFEPSGPVQLKDVAEPLPLFRALRP